MRWFTRRCDFCRRQLTAPQDQTRFSFEHWDEVEIDGRFFDRCPSCIFAEIREHQSEVR